jgi:YfiR/HmsC-like
MQMMRGNHFRLMLGLAMAVVFTIARPMRADESAGEYKVKAAFIYNFAQFVDWPDKAFAGSDSPFVLAVVGKDPFDGILEQVVAGKLIGGRRIVVQHFDSVDQIGTCQILFVPTTEDDSLSQIIQKVHSSAVLTIGESDDFDSTGGCFRFFTEDDKMRFEVNQEAAEVAGLRVSSKLLKLARIFKK